MGVIRVIRVVGSSVSVDRQTAHEFEENYKVAVEPGTTPLEVLRHQSVPKPYSRHPDFPIALADRVFIEQENARLYRVDVPYSSKLEPGQEPDQPENPLARRVRISVKSTTVRELIQTDWKGRPLINTAGDLLQGIEEDETLWQISAQRNVSPFIPSWFGQYGGAINKDSVRVRGQLIKKYQLKITDIDIPDTERENGVEFIPLSLSAVYREKGWRRKFLNFGLRERKQIWNEETEVFDDIGPGPIVIDGMPVSEPVPLDKDGRAYRDYHVTDTDVIEYIKTDVTQSEIEANLLEYETKPLLSFRRLNLFQ
jgi:type IV secretory pathway protease TraF